MEYGNIDTGLDKYKPILEEYENSCLIIKKIEEDISNIYNKRENYNQKCFLIELKDFENFKQQIDYQTFKNKIIEYRENILMKLIMLESEDKEIKLEKLKNTILKSTKELDILLKEKHEYILINAELAKDIIQKKEDGQYFCFYWFNSSELKIKINEDSFLFHLNKNIININVLKDKKFSNNRILSNDNENDNVKVNESNNYLGELIDWIEKFFLAEKEFKKSLIRKKENYINNYGYLIDLNEFNEWKNNLLYDTFIPILDNYINEEKKYLTKEEKEEIKIVLKDVELQKNKISSLNFKSIEELKHYNRMNNLILISRELFILINENEEKLNEIEFNVVANVKKIELIINNEKCSFNRLENIIYSYLKFNLFLLTRIFIFQKVLFKDKKPNIIYIFQKDFFQKYKTLFDYEKLQLILNNSNINSTNKNNEKEIYELIENFSVSYINSIKENISQLNNFIFEKEKFFLTEIKSEENISFNYLKYFDSLLFDGNCLINFININSIPKESFFRIKFFFIKDKILILFKNDEQNKIYGQIGTLNKLENHYSFDIDYLFAFKEYKIEFSYIDILDRVLKEEKDIESFYQRIYGENSKKCFKCKISEELILYVLNFSKNKSSNLIINKNNNESNSSHIINKFSNNNNFFLEKINNKTKVQKPFYDLNKIKDYLYIILSFFYSDQNIKMKMNRNNKHNSNYEDNLYVINKQWVKEFLTLFNINNEIYNIINSNPNVMTSNIRNIVEMILPELSDNTKQYFNNLDINNTIVKLADNSLIKIDEQYMDNNGTNLRLFFNFYFLEESFCKCLRQFLNLNFSKCLVKSECILINQKIFSFTSYDNVYIGNFGKDYSFYTEKIVFYHNLEAKNEIIKLVQSNNFNYINYLLFSGDLISNGYNIQMLNLNYQKSIKNSLFIEKLKDFIDFEIYNNKLIKETNKTNNNEDYISKEKVILIKKEALNLIGYYSIINIIKKYLQNLDNSNQNQLMDNIFNNITINDILLLKQEFNKIRYKDIKFDDILQKPDCLISFEDKNISIFNDVLVIKKDLIKLFLNIVNIEKEYVKQMVSGNGMNKIIIKTNEEKTLLLGNVINNEHTFKLQYIFNFKDGYELEKGMKKMNKSHIDYIDKFCMFEKAESFISPIFNPTEELVGYSYKYNESLLINPIYEYYLCDNLKNVVQLFNYYTFINNKFKNGKNNYNQRVTLSPDDYSLVNKSWVEKLKAEFYYNDIIFEITSGKAIDIMKNNNNNEDNPESTDKNIFTILKGINIDMYLKFNSDLKNKIFQNFEFKPNLVMTGYCDSCKCQQQFLIPNDFEILPKKFIEKYNCNNNRINSQYFNNIQIIDSLFLINLLFDLNGSGKYISLIGELDSNNTFEIKSVLIYYKPFQKKEILQEEQYSLHNIINQKERIYFKSKYENRDSETYDECFVYQFNPKLNKLNNNCIGNETNARRISNNKKNEFFSKKQSKKEIKLKIKNSSKMKFIQAYIINNEIIKKLKQNYNLNEAISYLNSNQQLNEINYQNFNENYQKLSEFLNKNQTNYIEGIKKFENSTRFKFDKNEGFLVFKKYNDKNNLKYVDKFEIIDKDFASYLHQIFNNSIAIYKIDYIKVEDKIFLIIDFNGNYIYEITSLNNHDIMIANYLIEIKKNNMTNNINLLNNYIGNLLLDNGIQNLIIYGNPINFGSDLTVHLHVINEYFN